MNDDALRAKVRKCQAAGFRSEAISYFGKAGFIAGAAYIASRYLPDGSVSMAGMGMLYMAKDKAFEVASRCGLAEETENMKRAKRLNQLEENFEIQKKESLEFNRNQIARLISEARKYVGYGLNRYMTTKRNQPTTCSLNWN